MTETIQEQKKSLVEQVRQMAGAADKAPAPRTEEPPVVLPDGYRRRSPVQLRVRRGTRRSRHVSRRNVTLLWLLAAAIPVIVIAAVLLHMPARPSGNQTQPVHRASDVREEIPPAPVFVPEGASDWAIEEISAAVSVGLVPDDLRSDYQKNITREEFCRLMVRLVSKASGKDETSIYDEHEPLDYEIFSDTRSADVLIAHELGIVNGVGDGKFNPGGSITREEAATMLARTAAGLELTSGQAITFHDSDSFSPWAKEGIALVSGLTDATSGKAVMGGSGDLFSPRSTYTREQAILTVLRIFHCCEG